MKATTKSLNCLFGLVLICVVANTTALAGPVILGGDDLDYHGNYNNGAGPNQKGWLYIQKAIANMYAGGCITCPNDGSIAVLGCPLSTLDNGTSNSSGHAGAAIHFAGNVALAKTVNYYDGVVGINSFFAGLTGGTLKPAIIYIPSEDTDAIDGISAAEGAALTAHANDIKNFVNCGGGLMAHISGPNTSGWVTAATGVTVTLGCNSSGATLTSTGNTAFPGLSNSDIDSTAGPCHATFSGSLSGLSVLALDHDKKNLIIGGGCGTVIGSGSPTPSPTPSPSVSPTPTPTPTPSGCAEVTGEARCLPGGGYGYTFNVKNNSGTAASQILLTPAQGSLFSLTPQLTNLSTPLQNGQSTSITTTIGNARPGDKVCFFVSLMSEKTQCCIIQVCLTLPNCGDVTPTPTVMAAPSPMGRQPTRGRRRP